MSEPTSFPIYGRASWLYIIRNVIELYSSWIHCKNTSVHWTLICHICQHTTWCPISKVVLLTLATNLVSWVHFMSVYSTPNLYLHIYDTMTWYFKVTKSVVFLYMARTEWSTKSDCFTKTKDGEVWWQIS